MTDYGLWDEPSSDEWKIEMGGSARSSVEDVARFEGLTPAVMVEHVRKSFGSKEVLHDVSFKIRPGEVVSLIGPSGAGKSTLLRGLTLLDTFDSGLFKYGDLVVCDSGDTTGKRRGRMGHYTKSAMREARMRFGLVFQNYNLFPHHTVLRNVMEAPIAVQKRPRDEVEAQARDLLDQVGLTEHVDKVPCELSGGQQQRVAIARALCMNPRVMYFDEATSALDPKLTADMRALIRRLASEGMAVGIVTHEMGFARTVSDRIAFLFDGEIVEDGPAEQVISNPRDERTRTFLGTASD